MGPFSLKVMSVHSKRYYMTNIRLRFWLLKTIGLIIKEMCTNDTSIIKNNDRKHSVIILISDIFLYIKYNFLIKQ
jgi:hypothetical protein